MGVSEKETGNRTVTISEFGQSNYFLSYWCILLIFFALAEAMKRAQPNSIRTTKYTWYTWLPKSLWEQFRRIANVYFLGISILMVKSNFFCPSFVCFILILLF
jgi:hypothetical protein